MLKPIRQLIPETASRVRMRLEVILDCARAKVRHELRLVSRGFAAAAQAETYQNHSNLL